MGPDSQDDKSAPFPDRDWLRPTPGDERLRPQGRFPMNDICYLFPADSGDVVVLESRRERIDEGRAYRYQIRDGTVFSGNGTFITAYGSAGHLHWNVADVTCRIDGAQLIGLKVTRLFVSAGRPLTEGSLVAACARLFPAEWRFSSYVQALERIAKAAEPGATDNPGDAQCVRED